MGGNSPTDHALQLAGKNLSEDWDEKVLLDAVDRARKNVQIRRNSINNTGVAGASANNPYAPPAAGASSASPPAQNDHAAPIEGAKRAIPGIQGGLAEFRGGKWVRVQ